MEYESEEVVSQPPEPLDRGEIQELKDSKYYENKRKQDSVDQRTHNQKKFDEDMSDRSIRNNAIIMEVDNSIEPTNVDSVKRAQHLFNVYVFQDDVLEVDGTWGNRTQEAFQRWKTVKKYANLHSSGTDLSETSKRYNINVSKKSDFEKQIEKDERIKELNSRIPQ